MFILPRYSYKHEYERFKLTVISIFMGISFFLILKYIVSPYLVEKTELSNELCLSFAGTATSMSMRDLNSLSVLLLWAFHFS